MIERQLHTINCHVSRFVNAGAEMEQLLSYLNSIHPLSQELVEFLKINLKFKELEKKSFLLKGGHVNSHIYFIINGLVRSFYYKDSVEVCSWFMKEGDVIISVESFFNQKVSRETIQALEDTTLLYLDYNVLQYIYNHFPEFNYVGRVLTEKYYTLSEQRLYSLRLQRSAERYQYMVENYPEIVQRVPSKYIASYLGITEETMSRIRGRK